jgi:hypothetical protein
VNVNQRGRIAHATGGFLRSRSTQSAHVRFTSTPAVCCMPTRDRTNIALAVAQQFSQPVASGIGAKLARLARLLTDASAAQRRREVDREIALLLARSGGRITDSMEREMMEKALLHGRRIGRNLCCALRKPSTSIIDHSQI